MFVFITLGTNNGLDCPSTTSLPVLSWQDSHSSHISATAPSRLSWFTEIIVRKTVSIFPRSAQQCIDNFSPHLLLITPSGCAFFGIQKSFFWDTKSLFFGIQNAFFGLQKMFLTFSEVNGVSSAKFAIIGYWLFSSNGELINCKIVLDILEGQKR